MGSKVQVQEVIDLYKDFDASQEKK